MKIKDSIDANLHPERLPQHWAVGHSFPSGRFGLWPLRPYNPRLYK